MTFIVICLRCYRVRRIPASALLFDSRKSYRLHRETPIEDLQPRVVCRGEGEIAGCGHRGGRIYMTLDGLPDGPDEYYVRRLLAEQCEPRRRRRWP
ncbi:hypothetical protein SM191_18215 [Sphingomonas sp. 2378]